MRNICVTLLIVFLSACASQPAMMQYHSQEINKVWPSAPDAPRFSYKGELRGESNFVKQEQTGAFKKALEWLADVVFGEATPRSLQRPASGWIDNAAGRIYVTDVGRHAVFVFDEALAELMVWENAAESLAFSTPIGIDAIDSNRVLVADADLGAVVELNAQGEPVAMIGKGALQRPTGVAVDTDGKRIFVADSKAHDIKVFSYSGELVDTWGSKGEGAGELNGPTYLSYRHGQLYVTDTLNSRVQIFNAQGEPLKTVGQRGLYIGNMPRPKGIASDAVGRIYVVESYYDYLLVYDAEGRLLLPIGGSGSQPGQFNLPAGVWTDGGDRIFVADMFNGRVVSFQYVGEDEIAAGGSPQ